MKMLTRESLKALHEEGGEIARKCWTIKEFETIMDYKLAKIAEEQGVPFRDAELQFAIFGLSQIIREENQIDDESREDRIDPTKVC